jgi:hypothetical protein
MTASELVTTLIARGVEFQAQGDRLRFRPAHALTPADFNRIRQHKAAILKLLRAEGLVHPAADPRPIEVCDRCGSIEYMDTPIHEGRSVRRDCALCRRFMGWPRWYGTSFKSDD